MARKLKYLKIISKSIGCLDPLLAAVIPIVLQLYNTGLVYVVQLRMLGVEKISCDSILFWFLGTKCSRTSELHCSYT